MGIDLSGLGIDTVAVSGEPGGAVPATRALLCERFGVSHIADGYGLTEVFPLGGNCRHSTSIHLAETASSWSAWRLIPAPRCRPERWRARVHKPGR